jgi:CRISP-associated protein Cas1
MIKRTLYFGNPAYLSTSNEQLVVKMPQVENNTGFTDSTKMELKASIPIEDIGVVILDHQQITITQVLISKLLENNTALITCNNTHHPTGLMLNLDGNSLQSEKFKFQVDASVPLKKQLWQQTVQAKIKNQAKIMLHLNIPNGNMIHWANEVKSGDPDNFEGRAAAYYWSSYFSKMPDIISNNKELTRHRDGPSPNPLLNYGYAILRAIVARSLVGTGLMPTFGIFHRNKYNAYCLADDIMEPYRPVVDWVVYTIVQKGHTELNSEAKKELLSIPTIDVLINGEKSPLMVATQRTTASLAKCFEGDIRKINYPELCIAD